MQSNPQSKIIMFYSGLDTDDKGRAIDDILLWDNIKLEQVHDYIQWLFPLHEESAYSTSAPILNKAEINEFRNNDKLKEKLLASFSRMLEFYGFEICNDKINLCIEFSNSFVLRTPNWLARNNHNFLRITRILKCLHILGLEDYAVAFLGILEEVYKRYPNIVGTVTLKYWRKAVI